MPSAWSPTLSLVVKNPNLVVAPGVQLQCYGPYTPPSAAKTLRTFMPEVDMDIVHHMIMFGGRGSQAGVRPGVTSSCYRGSIMYAWARTGQKVPLGLNFSDTKSDGDGFAVGPGTNVEWIALQIHYQQLKSTPVRDDSGVRLGFSTAAPARPLAVQLMASGSLRIPPRSIYDECLPCRVASGGTAVAWRNHAHRLARDIYSEHYRRTGEALPLVGAISSQQPQIFRVLPQALTLEKGERLLLHCNYDSLNPPVDRVTTLGADERTHEMCNQYLMATAGLRLSCGFDRVVASRTFSDAFAHASTSLVSGTAGGELPKLRRGGGRQSLANRLRGLSREGSDGAATTRAAVDVDESGGDRAVDRAVEGGQRQRPPPQQQEDALADAASPGPAVLGGGARRAASELVQGTADDANGLAGLAGVGIGQVTGLALDPSRGIFYMFHRAANRFDARTSIPGAAILSFTYDGGLAGALGKGVFVVPHGLSLDHRGYLWATDVFLHQVFRVDPKSGGGAGGGVVATIGTRGVPGRDGSHFNKPTDVAVHPRTGDVYVSDGYGNSRVAVFAYETGKFLREWGAPGSGAGQFRVPHSIVIDRRGDVFVADRENSRVQVFDAAGKYKAQWVSTVKLDAARQPYSRHVSSVSYDASLDLFAVTEGDGVTLRSPLGCAIVEYDNPAFKWPHDAVLLPTALVERPGAPPRNVSAMAEGAAYTVFVAELDGKTVRRLDSPSSGAREPAAASAPVSLYGRS